MPMSAPTACEETEGGHRLGDLVPDGNALDGNGNAEAGIVERLGEIDIAFPVGGDGDGRDREVIIPALRGIEQALDRGFLNQPVFDAKLFGDLLPEID